MRKAQKGFLPAVCNDFRLKAKLDYLIETFRETRIPLRFPQGLPNLQPREDIRITDRSPIIRMDEEGARLEMMRWSWPSPKGAPVFNYRSDGRRFPTGRCLVPADGFYEVTASGTPGKKTKDKWLFTPAAGGLFAIAGLVREKAIGEEPAFTLLTTEPGPDVAPYHDRQPAIVPRPQWSAWLDLTHPAAPLLAPSPAGSLSVVEAPRRDEDEGEQAKLV